MTIDWALRGIEEGTDLTAPVWVGLALDEGLAGYSVSPHRYPYPIRTAPNAIVYGIGYVRITDMMIFGVFLDLTGFFVVLVGLRLLCPLFGFA